MQAFEIKTNKSDYPYLVIASGFKKAVEILYEKGIYDTNIISVQQLEPYKSDHILHEGELKTKDELKEQVRRELQEAMPKWMPEPAGAAGGADRDIYLIRTSRRQQPLPCARHIGATARIAKARLTNRRKA